MERTQIPGPLSRVGGTPLVALSRLSRHYGCHTDILAKLELANPSGSVKDRAVRRAVEDALAAGEATEKTVFAAVSGGGLGVSLAMVCAALGLRAWVAAPEDTPRESLCKIRAYGALAALFPPAEGSAGAQRALAALRARETDVYLLNLFTHPAAVIAHREGTGPEIAEAAGQVDYFIAGSGTGGTVSGVGEALKQRFMGCRVIAVEPAASPVLSGGFPGGHGITGIGPGFVPENLNVYILDEVIRVRDADARTLMQDLARLEGIVCGISSGAALAASVAVARREEAAGRMLVTVLPE
jgi:cysteine synthase A